MVPKHLTRNFVAPVFFYLALIMYFFTALAMLASVVAGVEFLVVGGILFVLGYNAWILAKDVKE